MNLTEHYKELYESSIRKIENGDYVTDSLIDSPVDKRFGITLLIRPPKEVKDEIESFLEELKQIDSSQYYYPNADIHITVMSIISCYEGFRIDQISVTDYSNLIQQSLKGMDKFEIKFQGITASDSGIMIQGFPENEMLNNMRNNLRAKFKNSNLEQSIDRRYTIQTAHATTVRFRKELQNIKAFLAEIEKFKNYDFGSFEVKEFELVFNDWYQREQNSLLLGKFELQQHSTTTN
ncbi:2'-5' RNA ligase family protein [Salinimicrobium sp. WS361]|uniref:2'-5' RNA ligase family protein n=1 Tax=Salinimicrobium sp. WS361 TaxID=3425123 RepID=UPI003D701D70